MKIIDIQIKNKIINCPSCNSENLNEKGIKNICEHLIFIGTSHSDDPEIDTLPVIKFSEKNSGKIEKIFNELNENNYLNFSNNLNDIVYETFALNEKEIEYINSHF